MKTTRLFLPVIALLLTAHSSFATFSTPGQGMQTVLSGTVDNAGLYLQTAGAWANTTPTQPYSVQTSFTMPTVDDVVLGRLILTVWGGSAARTNVMDITVNGTSLVGGALTFGTTNDANASFSATQPSVYGSGSGVWLVSLPVTASLLHTDGSANTVAINETTPTFDGRIYQITLVSVYQDADLNNQFQYAIAEGSGDIYGSPSSPQVDSRTISFGGLTLANPTAASLNAVYTFGDNSQNDRLFFNDTQLGTDNLATWNGNQSVSTGTNYGPDVVSFDVLGLLGAETNDVRFSVSALDVPGTRETSLRPQVAVFTVQAIPEPSTLLLVGLGLGTLLLRRRRS